MSLREYYLSEKGYKIFAKEHGIAHSLFSSWLKKYQENGREGLQHKKRKLPQTKQMENLTESEIQYLKLIIAEQQIQIEKLKRELEKS